MESIEALYLQYQHLLNSQRFDPGQLDYSIVKKHLNWVQRLSELESSSLSVFDMYRKRHSFFSSRFSDILGYDLQQVRKEDGRFFARHIHPEDLYWITLNSIRQLEFLFQLPASRKKDFKLVNDYRLRNAAGQYVRVIEQHQILELDSHGNIWLALSTVNFSPNQNLDEGLKSTLYDTTTGHIHDLEIQGASESEDSEALSEREKEVLHLIRQGARSKEIAGRLYISVHTVNTHRQRILKKLNVSSSIEAVQLAARQGLI